MKRSAWKYFLAYPLSLLPALGLGLGGFYTWLTPIVVFGFLPLLELIIPPDYKNLKETKEVQDKAHPIFNILLYLNLPILYGSIAVFLWQVAQGSLTYGEWAGLTCSVGIICGTLGINVAHELGHHKARFDRWVAQALLLGSLYQHFYIEHNRGHHRWVATPHDPATARRGEMVYTFWFRSMWGGFRNAWQLEAKRLQGQWLTWNNQMLRFAVLQLAVIAVIFIGLSWQAGVSFLATACIGGLLLETVNYLEHYGLRRKEIRPGVYEPVKPAHSWNANHPLGRIVLYELTRHADHHYRASRPYQTLRHTAQSPQLPTGYPGMMLLSLAPPLWFRMMDKRVEVHQAPHA